LLRLVKKIRSIRKSLDQWEESVKEALNKLKEKEILADFAGEHDHSNAVLSIRSGAGGYRRSGLGRYVVAKCISNILSKKGF